MLFDEIAAMLQLASLHLQNVCSQAALVAAKTEKGVMSKALRKSEAVLREMVAVTLRSDLTRNQRTALETCITVHMHQKVCQLKCTAAPVSRMVAQAQEPPFPLVRSGAAPMGVNTGTLTQ